MDPPVLHTLVERLRADERLPAFAEALPARARVAEPALPLLLAALHEELARGLCVLLPEDTDRHYVFVAGGIGITVFRSMLRYVAEEHLPYRVTLIYSNRDRESTAFLDELVELERVLAGFRLVLTMTAEPGWDGESRKIDAHFFEEHLEGDLNRYTFLVAGPPGMTEAMEKVLGEAGVKEENVIAEGYTGY